MAVIGNDEIAFLKAMYGASRGIDDKDVELHGTGGRFQDDGLGRCVRRLWDGLQNGLQESTTIAAWRYTLLRL